MRRTRFLGVRLVPQRSQPTKAPQATPAPTRPQPRQHGRPPTEPSTPPATSPLPGRAEDSRPLEPPRGTVPEGRPELELKGMLELLGSVAAPVTVVTSVLFYFGWAYTGAFYRYFGIDRSALDLSVRDYVLRSINPMLWPLILGLVLAALWTWVHGLVVRVLADGRRRPLVRRLSMVVGGVGVACFVTGLVAPSVGNPSDSLVHELLTPLGLAAGAALVGYAGHLYRRAGTPPQANPPAGAGEPRWLRQAGLGLVAVLVTINLLWAVTYFADALGRGDGYRLAAAQFGDRPAVVVYSTKRLFLDPFGGVQESPLPDKDNAYRFRYANLRLLTRAGGKYFLVPNGWSTADPVVIVLSDNDTIRIEFIRIYSGLATPVADPGL
jgi:hypothetical protein